LAVPKRTSCDVALLPAVQVKVGVTLTPVAALAGFGALAVPGTGNVVEAVRHQRTMLREMAWLTTLRPEQYVAAAKDLGAPVELVRQVAATGALPVVNFAAGGLATPADAALMMQLGVDGVFVGSGIFKSEDPAPRARARSTA
jgi:pyridoxal biosynthesis lyase PdxS